MQSNTFKSYFSHLLRNLQRTGLALKLIVIALVAFTVILALSGYLAQQSSQKTLEANAQKDLGRVHSILLSELKGYEATSASLALVLASRDDIKDLYLRGDRLGLLKLLNPIFSELKQKYSIVHLYIETDQGIVFLRVHNPTQLDDDVTYRSTVASAIATQALTTGFEVGANGPSVRSVAPLFKEGKLIGLLEVGIDFGQSFLEKINAETGANATLWLYAPNTNQLHLKPQKNGPTSPNENFFYFAGTQTDNLKTSRANLEKNLLTGQPVSELFFKNETAPQATLLLPLTSAKLDGFQQTFFGTLEISLPYDQQIAEAEKANQMAQSSRLIGTLAGLLLLGFAINIVVLKPLRTLSEYARKNSSGEITEALQLHSGDELELLATGFNEALASIQAGRQEMESLIQQRTAQLQAVNDVARIASSILDPDELISKVVNVITERFGYYYAAIFLNRSNNRWAELKDATGTAGEILKARHHRLQIGGNSMVGAAIQSREAHIALDVGDAPVRFNNPLLPNTRSEIALPLIVGESVVGALDVQSTRENDFKPEDIATLQSLANQVAIALENARLFDEMNNSIDELRQTNQEYVASAWGNRLKNNTIQYSTGVSNLLEGESETSQKINLPLKLREQIIGNIEIETGQEWSSEDQAWAEALATQLAVSLENTRLLEESQQSALRERMSANIIQKLWSADSVDSILQTAVREIGRALEATEAIIELKIEE